MSIENDSARPTYTRLPLAAGRLPFAALQLREKYLIAALLALGLAALFGPTLPATAWPIPHYVDTRTCLGLPNAGDVLSNLAFLVMGVWGLARLHARNDAPVGARCFFVGLILTCIGSSFYHLDPDLPQRLIADRLGMAVAFAGFLGIAAGERVSVRAGRATVMLVMVAGLLAAWVARENLTPWVVVQFGGIALAVGLALVRPLPGALGVPLGGVLFFYAAAKLLELGDATMFEVTGHIVSGHTLKHLSAALAALPVIWALRSTARAPSRH
jgi:predicted membrane channel-forming protein YqfA (hemolysin III family)